MPSHAPSPPSRLHGVIANSEDRALYWGGIAVTALFPIVLLTCAAWSLAQLGGGAGESVRALGWSIALSVAALALAGPLGVGAALYVQVFSRGAGRRGKVVSNVLDHLSIVPSVVWGVFARATFASLWPEAPLWASVLCTVFVLALVLAPTLACSVRDGLAAVPIELEDAAMTLGGSRWAALRLVVIPTARRFLSASLGTALGRALGEAIAVSMVLAPAPDPQADGAAAAESVSTLGMRLALGSGAPASAGILFALCLSVQLAARRWARRPPSKQPLRKVGAYAKRTHSLAIITITVLLGTFFALVLWLAGHAHADTSAITEAFSTSGWLAMGALLFAAPIGIVGALFVFEFEATRAARWLRLSAELLMSTPPVIVGGAVAWLAQRHIAPPHTLACFALGILLAPSVMRRALRVIANVPLDLREAALSLGASRMQMVSQVIFATSRRQLLSAAFAALARTFGSTAPLILLLNVTSLPTYVFRHSLAGDTSRAAAAALVLLLIVSVFKALSIALQPSEMRA